MTEEEWLACTDPIQMLNFLRDKLTDRKLRLFCVAYCRHPVLRAKLVNAHVQEAIVQAERFADGNGTAEKLAGTVDTIRSSCRRAPFPRTQGDRMYRDEDVIVFPHHIFLGIMIGTTKMNFVDEFVRCGWQAALSSEVAAESQESLNHRSSMLLKGTTALCRDIFGNPCRPVSLNPSWCTSSAVTLAQGIYDERAFDRVFVLADALEEAGCTDADILGHLRGPGPHVRGCWVVDLLLGKQ